MSSSVSTNKLLFITRLPHHPHILFKYSKTNQHVACVSNKTAFMDPQHGPHPSAWPH